MADKPFLKYEPLGERIIQNVYLLEACTPKPSAEANINGLIYKEVPSLWGTQSFSSSTRVVTASRKSSVGIFGIHKRSH